jgi:O-Antigen ligase.
MWAYSASAVVTVFVLVAGLGIADAGRTAAFSGQDPAQFSAVLLPAFLFLVYEGAHAASRRDAGRIAALLILAGAGLVAWGALVSGTRSAMVGLGVGLAAMTATGTGHRGGRLSIAAVGLVGAGAALLAPGVLDSVLVRLSGAVSTGGSGREDIWAVGATIFGQHPLSGVGYAGFPSAFTSDVIRISAVPGLAIDALYVGRGPHSILVGTAAELGVIGIVLLGLFLWRVLSARSGLGLSNFVRAALVAILAQAMLLDLLNRKQLWLVLGMAVGLAAVARVQEAGAKAPRLPPDIRPASAGSSQGRSERAAAHAG